MRAHLARLLVAEPALLLLDEPTAGVDPGAEAAIIDVIAALNRDAGLTVLLVSHHLRLVRAFVRTVIWVGDGTATKGTAEELLSPERLADTYGTAR